MDTRELVTRYYDSLNSRDGRWKSLWAQDAVFSDASKTLQAQGLEAVIASFEPFLGGVRTVRVIESIVEGSKACFVVRYTYVNQKSEAMEQDVAEVWQIRDGKLASLILYFDLTAYRSFIRG